MADAVARRATLGAADAKLIALSAEIARLVDNVDHLQETCVDPFSFRQQAIFDAERDPATGYVKACVFSREVGREAAVEEIEGIDRRAVDGDPREERGRSRRQGSGAHRSRAAQRVARTGKRTRLGSRASPRAAWRVSGGERGGARNNLKHLARTYKLIAKDIPSKSMRVNQPRATHTIND